MSARMAARILLGIIALGALAALVFGLVYAWRFHGPLFAIGIPILFLAAGAAGLFIGAFAFDPEDGSG